MYHQMLNKNTNKYNRFYLNIKRFHNWELQNQTVAVYTQLSKNKFCAWDNDFNI